MRLAVVTCCPIGRKLSVWLFLVSPMIRLSLFPAALALSLVIQAPAQTPSANSAPAAEKAAEASDASKEEETKPEVEEEPEFPEAIDIGGFGTDEPVERPDLPKRGVVKFGPDDYQHSNGAHWETYTWTKFKAKRWGRYQVRLTYVLKRAALGMQFRIADLAVKRSLETAYEPRKAYLGTVYIAQPGDVPFSLLTPPTDDAGFLVQEIALIPAPEGGKIEADKTGAFTLLAKDATTWSEAMRYEPKPEKNCLGFWTSADDFAEWEFEVAKSGRYQVTVTHGCGGGNHGSEVEVKLAGKSLKFKTQDTGGFQKWSDVVIGEIEISKAGLQRLVIDPVNKVKAAILDVQKITFTPAG